ncbi:hypothetical protein [Paraburkholderia sp. SIMBA_054]|uniref:hypothetical protein n=1 Tax=Paraburkholderia sp. SIMBA_054 TaxID=3085795 RepID=UPI00397C6C00
MADNIDRDALRRSAADECMTPDQLDLYLRIGEQDRDVYTRLYRCIAKRIEPAERSKDRQRVLLLAPRMAWNAERCCFISAT